MLFRHFYNRLPLQLLSIRKHFLTNKQNYTVIKNTQTYHNYNIIPDVFDEAPNGPLIIQFKNGIEVDYGNILQPKDVLEPPIIQWEHDAKKYYTLCMLDVDLPTRLEPILRSFQLWFVGNILGQNYMETGETYANYIGIGPPKNTGYHRYVIFVCEQKNKIDYSPLIKGDLMLPRYRNHFNYKEFSKQYNLGIPIAGNFFLAQYDETVPKVYKKLNNLSLFVTPLK